MIDFGIVMKGEIVRYMFNPCAVQVHVLFIFLSQNLKQEIA